MRAFLIAGVILLGSGSLAFAQLPRERPPDPRDYPPPPPRFEEPDRRAQEEARQAAVQREMERLQGTWVLISVEQNGRVVLGSNDNDQLTIRRDRFSRVTNGQPQESGRILMVDPEGRLKRVLFIRTSGPDREIRFPTLLELKGDRLCYVCTSVPRPGDARDFPRRLETRPEDGLILVTWRRLDR